jgi:glycosyltransferase involved in cell wall biosynthesis
MNILMMTNTFTPHVGGVAGSVSSFTETYRARGHRVMVIAPEFDNQPAQETDVLRIPALQHFNGSDFSVVLTVPGYISDAVERFKPDIIHSHHPFLIGSNALRFAYTYDLPLVFTHHTFFERYTHYVPGDSDAMKRFVIELSTHYANLCDQVFAPSESVAEVLLKRGVSTPVAIVPTGVPIERYRRGSGSGFRAAVDFPEDAFVVGHIGRLAKEKNLEFLAEAVAAFMTSEPRAHFLVVGSGPAEKAIREIFARRNLQQRLHMIGVLRPPLLISAYRAMDVFAFASQSETQGMVLSEAMAAGAPVIGVDAPGVREVVVDQENGRLLAQQSVEDFSAALGWLAALPAERRQALRAAALATGEKFSMQRSADKALQLYEQLCSTNLITEKTTDDNWQRILRSIEVEWDLLRGMASATGAALTGDTTPDDRSLLS